MGLTAHNLRRRQAEERAMSAPPVRPAIPLPDAKTLMAELSAERKRYAALESRMAEVKSALDAVTGENERLRKQAESLEEQLTEPRHQKRR